MCLCLSILLKVVFIVGVAGATRKIELVKLTTDAVVDNGAYLTVDVPDTKTYSPRQFMITSGSVNGFDLLDIMRRYISLRPKDTLHNRFFINYRNGQCTRQPLGINKFSGIPKQIAQFLGLADVDRFGHCFRRSSITKYSPTEILI